MKYSGVVAARTHIEQHKVGSLVAGQWEVAARGPSTTQQPIDRSDEQGASAPTTVLEGLEGFTLLEVEETRM